MYSKKTKNSQEHSIYNTSKSFSHILASRFHLTLLAAAFSIVLLNPSVSLAAAAGGPNCGWGNMLFQGDKGKVAHGMAYITNGLSSANAFFGIILGSNGCETDGVLSYSGTPMLGLNHILDELAVDIAQGEGEALGALTLALEIKKEDRSYFKQLMHKNFNAIFTHDEIIAEEVMGNIVAIVKSDARLNMTLS